MEKNIEEIYKNYQKKSDSIILKSYYKLMDKTDEQNISDQELLEVNNELKALKKVIEERELRVKKHVPKSAATDRPDPFKDGGKAILIGVIIFVISLVFMNKYDGNKVFMIGAIIGGFKMIQGFIIMGVGFFYKITNR